MRIVVTGSTGLIGSSLVPAVRADGHEVVRLVRRAAAAPDEVRWDPAGGTVDTDALGVVDAAVHLAGAGVGDHRWTAAYKQEILRSRVEGTGTLVKALVAMDPLPRTFVCGSAIGWYGDTGDTAVDETAPSGAGFLAGVVREWEAATAPAAAAGIRTVLARTGLVVAPGAGAFGKLVPIFKLGGGGKIGSGRQYWSFISITDEVAALRFLISADGISGPVNLTAPTPVTNAAATRALADVLHRPAVLPVPGFALKAVLGQFAEDVLASQRVVPRVLEGAGFAFAHPTVEAALAAELG
jgi:uncharacterized protein (TIGR01777 family)